uniref:Uncharacterized protein n=1 Tax=Tanacetum cinerariifolium TaxID=118510 RepID=A0A6L2J2H6_TANCI|nr:hypothetical protein [Tanacetum cinerariifolium]
MAFLYSSTSIDLCKMPFFPRPPQPFELDSKPVNLLSKPSFSFLTYSSLFTRQEKASDHEYILLPFMPSSTQSSDDKDAGDVPDKGDEGVNPSMTSLEEIGIFDDVCDDREVGTEAKTNNLELLTVVSPIPTTRVHKDHPKERIIRDLNLATQTRRMLNFFDRKCYEPKKIIQALADPSWIEAMQEELLQFKLQKQTKTNQASKIKKLKKKVTKLKGKMKKRTHRLKRLYKIVLSARIVSLDEEGLGDQEDASKQGRIVKIDASEDLSLINETAQDQGRINDQDLFGVHDLNGDKVFVDVTTGENVEQDAIVAKKVVITIKDIEVTTVAATTPQISKDELTSTQMLMEIKVAKPKAKGVTIQESSEFRTTSLSQLPQAKDKETEMKAEMDEEERIAIEKNEANIAVIEEWDDVQAIIDADKQLAEQLQAQEREQLSIKERSKFWLSSLNIEEIILLPKELRRSETSHPQRHIVKVLCVLI